jgi:hypothetical protein
MTDIQNFCDRNSVETLGIPRTKAELPLISLLRNGDIHVKKSNVGIKPVLQLMSVE